MNTLTTDQAILGHFSPGFGGSRIPDWLKPWLENGLGGITLFSTNCPTLEKTAALIAELRSYNSKLIISIDEEGGDVTRLFVREGSPFPSPALLGRCDDLDLTYSSYRNLGTILKDLGVDMSFAPVADVVVEKENPIIGVRSFGSDFSLVTRHTLAAIRGFKDAGIASSLKHFPGHGGVMEDSHHHLPRISESLSELTATHLAPFLAAIAEGVDSIMIGHMIVEALDDQFPASLSKPIITKYLKESLGFNGLVVTDALDMGALGGIRKIAQSSRRAIQAGADLLCFSGLFDQSEMIESSFKGIKAAIKNQELDAKLLEKNAYRIREWNRPTVRKMASEHVVDPKQLAKGMEIHGDVIIGDREVHLVEMSADPTIAAGHVAWGMRRSLSRSNIQVKLETSNVSVKAKTDFCLVVAFRDAFRDERLMSNLVKLQNRYPDAIFVDLGWSTLNFKPSNLVRTYGSGSISSDIAAQILIGKIRSVP